MSKKYDANTNKYHPVFNLSSISELMSSSEESTPLLRKSSSSSYNTLAYNTPNLTPKSSKQYTVPETSRILLVRNPNKPIRISHISHLESMLNSSSAQGPYYWLYIFQPISFEIELISQMLDLHPLTLEDLITQDPVEKCEEFQNYYVTSFKLIELNLSSSASIDETIDLRRDIPDPQYTFVYNVIHPNCIVTFDYGNHSIQDSVLSLLQKPDYQKKIVPDWVGGVMLHSFIEHLDTQLKFLEQEIIAVNDFYLISEDFEGITRHFSPKEGESQLPPRLTQLRKIASDFVEILEIKPNLFNSLLKIFGKAPYSTVSRPSSLYSSKAPSQIGTPARSSSPVRSLYESTRSLSPVPSLTDLSGASTIQKLHAESLEKGLSRSLSRSSLLDSTDIEIWINSSCTQIVGMLREAKLLQTILEKSFELQKTNWDFEMTYSATAFNDKLAFFSALTWAILPFSLGSLLMGMNVVVPGMSLPDLDGFVNTLGTMTLATLFLLYIARQLELV